MKRAQELREETLRLKSENKLPVFSSGMKSPPPKPVVVRLPCIYEGPVLEWCNSCSGQLKHVRECDVYEKCTRITVGLKVQGCDQCSSYIQESPKLTPGTTKNQDEIVHEHS